MKTQNPTGRNLATVTECQDYLKTTDASATAFLQSCISYASSYCESYCDKGLKFNEYSDYYDGNNKSSIFINQYPIISISSLQYQLTPTSSWTDFYDLTSSASANIIKEDGGRITLYDSTFAKGINNIYINYTAGYETVPADLRRVCVEMVAKMWDESKWGTGKLNIQSSNVGTGGFSSSNSFAKIEERWEKTLEKYKKITA